MFPIASFAVSPSPVKRRTGLAVRRCRRGPRPQRLPLKGAPKTRRLSDLSGSAFHSQCSPPRSTHRPSLSPLISLQLRGGEPDRQRAISQPFKLIVLTLASVGMAVSGQITMPMLWIAFLSLPATLLGAWIGARVYGGVSAQTFQRVVLWLLLTSGCILLVQALTP